MSTPHVVYNLALIFNRCENPGDWRSGSIPALPGSIKKRMLPDPIKNI